MVRPATHRDTMRTEAFDPARTPCRRKQSRQAMTPVIKRRGALGKIMRRRLEIFIPIVLLSILVQLMAPIAAFRVVAYAATDPLYMAPTCSGMDVSADAQTSPARTQHDRAECCVFCAAGHGGPIVAGSPSLIFVSLHRQYQLISWLEAAEPMPAVRVGSNTQARAPPLLT